MLIQSVVMNVNTFSEVHRRPGYFSFWMHVTIYAARECICCPLWLVIMNTHICLFDTLTLFVPVGSVNHVKRWIKYFCQWQHTFYKALPMTLGSILCWLKNTLVKMQLIKKLTKIWLIHRLKQMLYNTDSKNSVYYIDHASLLFSTFVHFMLAEMKKHKSVFSFSKIP